MHGQLGNTLRRAEKKGDRKPPKWLREVDVEDFLESLEVNNVHRSSIDEIAFSCPFSGHSSGDSTPSAYMNDGAKEPWRTTYFKCHGCGRSGTAITFLAEHEGISRQEASRYLREEYAPNFHAPKGGSISAEFEMRVKEREQEQPIVQENPVIPWDRYHDLFTQEVDWTEAAAMVDDDPDCYPAVRYMFDRGFLPSTLEMWEIGYDVISDRLTIPVTRADGKLVGVKARTWKRKKRPKYLVLGDKEGKPERYGFKPFEKSLEIFGIDRVQGAGSVVLDEGEINVMAFEQYGIPAISTGSAHVSEVQAQIIRDTFDEVIVCFDSNAAGMNAAWGFHNKDGIWKPGIIPRLEPFLRVRVVKAHDQDASTLVECGKVDEMQDLIDTAWVSFETVPGKISKYIREAKED